ncbi:probable helicase with zinc finger domain isoform X3 [Anguilla anguilla]|uniref:probable helicase with zinc finger domain isoform X3 n=1 Tax=Anguilla anguilla TaxID=7936 RepID=UPI0015AC3E71|nr:probable helicase with zinc finger domain isoform X3 [Anguilla anguilla]
MGESEPDVVCAQVCEHLSRQEYHLALCCCDEVLAVPPSPTTSSTGTTTLPEDHCVHVLALLCRVSAHVQLKKFTAAEEDSKNVMCLQELLGDGTLKDLLVSMLLDGRLTEICQALFNCDSEEWKENEGNMKYFRQLMLLLTESQVSSSAARVSEEDGREGILVERRWKHRAPPRGVLGIDEYTLCLRFLHGGECPLGELCVSAHSHGELLEWRQRLLFGRLQGQRARRARDPADSYGESLVEKWMRNPLPHTVVSSSMLGVTVDCVPDLHQAICQKHCSVSWTLRLDCNPPRPLRRVALLSELHRALFRIAGVAVGGSDGGPQPRPPSQPQQEWSCDGGGRGLAAERVYQVTLLLTAHAFGSFQQTVVFDFGSEPVLLQTVSAELAPPTDLALEPQPRGAVSSVRWDSGCKQVTVVGFLPRDEAPLDQSLLQAYQIPAAADQLFTRSVLDRSLTPHNYRSRLHDLLYIEENAQYMELSRLSLQTSLRLVTAPTVPGLQDGAGPLLPGQLFAQMGLSGTGVRRDTAGGRLVWDTVDSVLVLPALGQQAGAGAGGRERVYEAQVEERRPECMLLRLSEDCCRDLRLQPDQDLQVELQFQLNRLPLCEMHFALDSLQDCCTLLFPEPPSAGAPPSFSSVEGMDARLNEQQRAALGVITAPLSLQLPPVLLCGPPGTGKTFTLLQATVALLGEDINRVLLCSQSEAAADALMNELQIMLGHSTSEDWLLRLQGCSRPGKYAVAAAQCCSGIAHSTAAEIQQPWREEVNRSRVVVCTVRQAKHLIQLRLDTGCFTHVLVDEASSAPECETVMALSLAGPSTRVVLAGDPAQLPPLVYSEFARERGLQRPLLERLSGLYPQDSSCWVKLTEQYRSQQHIVRLVSELFYKGELRAGSKQPVHKDFFPLSFFVAWGTDKSGCGYLNYAEVLEVAEQVENLCKKWPVSWGKLEEGSVGVLTPYPSQALCLRSELQRRNLSCAAVQTLVTLPGRYFRVLFLSTVRTRHSLKQQVVGGASGASGARRREAAQEEEESVEDRELGFLSSPRALRSVLLCAQSLLAVVGDPVALCTMGKCRRIWERFLSACASEGSLHGATLPGLLEQVDVVESRCGGVLNPLAPEFVPRGPASPALTRRLPASLPRITVKRSSSQPFKQPLQRERYGQVGPCVPQGAPPYLLALSSGRPCVYGRSPSPLPRLGPLSRTGLVCDPYRSRLLVPVPLSLSCSGYANRVPVDPRVVACQAAVAYNFNLLQTPASPASTGLSPRLRSPPQSYRSPTDSSLDPGRAGADSGRAGEGPGRAGADSGRTGLGTLCLWPESEGREQVAGGLGFRRSRSPGLPHLEPCSTPTLPSSRPYSSPSPPPFGRDGSPPPFRTSPELGHPYCSRLPGGGLCHPSMQNGSYGSGRCGDEEPSGYSPWAEQNSLPLSPLLHSAQTSPFPPGDSPLHSPTTSPGSSLGYGTEDSWASLGSFSSSAQAFQHSPLEQRTRSGPELYCSPRPSPRPSPAECAEGEWMGGRRLYQRSSSSLCTTGASPPSRADGDPSPPSSFSVWAQERQSTHHEEKAYPASGPELGGVQSSEVHLQSAWACASQVQPNDPLALLQELGRRGDQEDSAYYSYFH